MKKLIFTGLIYFCFLFVFGQTDKTIVGYYPNWQWYDRANLINPEVIFYEKYTIINYAFFNPLADGSIVSTDAWADEQLLLGPMIWWPDPHNDSTKSLPYLAHQAGVKVLPSIGGWTLSYNFPGIAADPVKRQNFADHCVELINTYNFDGIDMDWEYPGYTPNGGTPSDKQNFTLLLQDIRAALDELEISTGEEYLLTSCFGAAHSRMENIEWENVLSLVDMVNLMTYDFHGSWDPESNHHTPLYSPEVGDPEWCFEGAFIKLTQEFGVPAEKVNLGIAFYGKALANCTQLYGPHTGYDGSTFWEDEGQPLYYNILKKMDMFTNYWDDQVKCPYLLGNSINTFVTFDNTESVAYKANYVKGNNAKGIIIWEITGDYLETYPGSGEISGTPLLDTIHATFKDIELDLKVFLEGPFAGSGMNTDLADLNILPLSQPYTFPPWNYSGTESVSLIPNSDVVDWIIIELRDATDAVSAGQGTMAAQQAAFLLNNGSVVGLDGNSNLRFNHTVLHQLFVIIWHRNHLGIMTGNPLIETGGIYSYDFTSSETQAFNSGQKNIGGIYGMYAGNAVADSIINDLDKSFSWLPEAALSGYLNSDLNLDGQSDNKDKNEFWLININETCQVP